MLLAGLGTSQDTYPPPLATATPSTGILVCLSCPVDYENPAISGKDLLSLPPSQKTFLVVIEGGGNKN